LRNVSIRLGQAGRVLRSVARRLKPGPLSPEGVAALQGAFALGLIAYGAGEIYAPLGSLAPGTLLLADVVWDRVNAQRREAREDEYHRSLRQGESLYQ
jgi:hypothetical protein